jgi:hypothetical protein
VAEVEDVETPEEAAEREAREAEREARAREWHARMAAEAAEKAAALEADETARMEQEEEARATLRRLCEAGIPYKYDEKAPIVAALVRAEALAEGRPAPAWTIDPSVRPTSEESKEQQDAYDHVERRRVYAIATDKNRAEKEAKDAKLTAEVAALDAQIAAKLRADSSPEEIEEAARLRMERDTLRDRTTRFDWEPHSQSSNRKRDLKAREWAIRKAQRRQAALIAAAGREAEAPPA